jgi:hypothetical protein
VDIEAEILVAIDLALVDIEAEILVVDLALADIEAEILVAIDLALVDIEAEILVVALADIEAEILVAIDLALVDIEAEILVVENLIFLREEIPNLLELVNLHLQEGAKVVGNPTIKVGKKTITVQTTKMVANRTELSFIKQ